MAQFDGAGRQLTYVNCILPKGDSATSFARHYYPTPAARHAGSGIHAAALMTGKPAWCLSYDAGDGWGCVFDDGSVAVCTGLGGDKE